MRVLLLLLLLCLPLGADELSELREACREEKDPAKLKSLSLKAWELAEQLCVPYAEVPLLTALNKVSDRAELLDALARHYIEVAEPEKAAKCYRDAGRPYDPDFWAARQGKPFRQDPRTERGRQLWAQGKQAEARETLEAAVKGWEECKEQFKTTAFAYPGYGDALKALAETGNQQAAKAYAEFQYPRLNRLLCYSSAEGRLELVRNLHLVELLAPFGATPELARAVLRSKGLAIDTLLEDARKGFLPEGQPLLKKIEAAKTPRERALAEMELAAFNNLGWGRKALEADPEAIRYYLKDAALAEFIRFGDHYGVLVMTEKDTKWCDLGPAAALEAQVQAYQRAVRSPGDLQPVLEAGYKAWVAPWIGTNRTLILSPDGALNFVSFASLVGPQGRFLAEDKDLRLVSTGRDLTLPFPGRYSTRVLLLGDPDFQKKPVTTTAGVRGGDDLRYLGFAALPGARQEVQELQSALPSAWTGELLLGPEATEAELRKRVSTHPAVLHLATHGFFLPELARGSDPNQRLSRPMQRSGMALAGAQGTVLAWKEGRIPPEAEDGILTAEDVATLNLKSVWLVVLSACDTGLGEARAGEGVLGLRRAFILAGAGQVLFTLWPVSDQVTRMLMKDFYARALAGTEPPWRSLATTQRDWLVKLRQQKDLSAAARLAGAFVLSSTGPR